jgi:hypothetical protein
MTPSADCIIPFPCYIELAHGVARQPNKKWETERHWETVTMSMSIKVRNDLELLLVVATGHFSIEDARKTFLQILEAVERYQSMKVLFDATELVGEPTTIERFYYGDFAASEVKKLVYRHGCSAPRFAYVLKPPVLDPQRFGENVAVNRGMIVRTFESMEDALAWL